MIRMDGGFPCAAKAKVMVEETDEGFYYANFSVGNFSDSKTFDTFEDAAAFVDRFLNPPADRRLSEYVRTHGKLMQSRYDGTDLLGQDYTAGDDIYYLGVNGKSHILKA